MGNFLQNWAQRLLGLRETSSDVIAVGQPNQGTPGNPQDKGVAGELGSMVGTASNKLKFTRKEIPGPGEVDRLVTYIKEWRAQMKIRPVLSDLAFAIVDNFRLKGSKEVSAWSYQSRLYAKLQRIALELSTVGWCVVYVSEDPKLPPQITVLSNVSVKRDAYGKEVIYLQLSDDAKSFVTANAKFYPSYWRKQLASEAGINITRVYDAGGKLIQGGAYFLTIEADGEDVFPVPPVYPYLAAAADAERVSDGIGSFVDMVKYYMIHAKVGGKDGADSRDGRPKPPSDARLRSVFDALSVGFRSGAMVTGSDVDVDFKVLEGDPFKVARDVQRATTNDIQKQLGAPDFVEASSEGAAMYMARGFLPSLRFLRYACITDQFLKPLMADLASQGRLPGADQARCVWSEDMVHDMTAKINLAKFKHTTGAYSLQSLCESIDPDFDLERELPLKEFEKKNEKLIGNIYEMAQGLADRAVENQKTNQPQGPEPNPQETGAPSDDPGGRPPK